MTRTAPPAPQDDLTRQPMAVALAKHAAASDARIARVTCAGRGVWIKRTERLSGRMRWQKGDPSRALRREVAALRALAACGLPVADLVGVGPDWLAVADAGPSLDALWRDPETPQAERIAAFSAAGNGLAQLHAAGFAHGRPSPRDICWKDGAVRFIDLENCPPGGAGPTRQGLDALTLAFNLHAMARGPAPEVTAALTAYRQAAPAAVLTAARRLARALSWAEPLTRPWQHRDAGMGEFRAIPPTLRHFTHG